MRAHDLLNFLPQALVVLVVVDNPNDLELALHGFKRHHLANRVQVARDGVEALDVIFGTGRYAGRRLHDGPAVVLLDLKLPLVDGLEVLQRVKSDPLTRALPEAGRGRLPAQRPPGTAG